MSVWRKKAVELMPDLKRQITSPDRVWNKMSLWIELRSTFEIAAREPEKDAAILNQIWAYYRWTMEESSPDITEVLVAFVEHWFESPSMTNAVLARLGPSELRGYQTVIEKSGVSSSDYNKILTLAEKRLRTARLG